MEEREPHESISHKGLPTWQEHIDFINRIPYKGWYIIKEDERIIGSVYLSYNNEIGIHILKFYRRSGFASIAIELLMEKHPEKFYLANINPANEKSIKLFNKLGFSHIQNTYKLSI